jgi:hypothetical protein
MPRADVVEDEGLTSGVTESPPTGSVELDDGDGVAPPEP